jgi:hypothetical protein
VAGVTSPSSEHTVGGVSCWALCPCLPAWRCSGALGGPSVVAVSSGGAPTGDARQAAMRARGPSGAWVGVIWPLVFVFFKGEGGGDLLRGTGSGSGVLFMAKVTFFPLPFTPLRVTFPGGLAKNCWPVRSTRKYILCEFLLSWTVTHPFCGTVGTKRPTLPYGFFPPHKVLAYHLFFA